MCDKASGSLIRAHFVFPLLEPNCIEFSIEIALKGFSFLTKEKGGKGVELIAGVSMQCTKQLGMLHTIRDELVAFMQPPRQCIKELNIDLISTFRTPSPFLNPQRTSNLIS